MQVLQVHLSRTQCYNRIQGALAPQDFFKIMQFSGNFKGKIHILSTFWAQGPLLGQNSTGPPWPKSWIHPWHCAFLDQFQSIQRIFPKESLERETADGGLTSSIQCTCVLLLQKNSRFKLSESTRSMHVVWLFSLRIAFLLENLKKILCFCLVFPDGGMEKLSKAGVDTLRDNCASGTIKVPGRETNLQFSLHQCTLSDWWFPFCWNRNLSNAFMNSLLYSCQTMLCELPERICFVCREIYERQSRNLLLQLEFPHSSCFTLSFWLHACSDITYKPHLLSGEGVTAGNLWAIFWWCLFCGWVFSRLFFIFFVAVWQPPYKCWWFRNSSV